MHGGTSVLCVLGLPALDTYLQGPGRGLRGAVGTPAVDSGTYLEAVVLCTVVCDGNEVVYARYCVFTLARYKQEDRLRETNSIGHQFNRTTYIPL